MQRLPSMWLAAPTLAMASLMPTAAQGQTSASAYTSGVRYDMAGRQVGTIAPDPDGAGALKFAATRTTYDAAGRPIKVETGELASWQATSIAPSAWTGFTVLSSVETSFDALDRKIKDVAKGNTGTIISVTQYSYDSVGRLDCTVVRMNSATFAGTQPAACTLGTEGTQGPDRITKNHYNAAGEPLRVQKALGTSLVQDYVTYTYTNNGKQKTVKDANGNLATYEYDGHDRMVAWRMPSKANGTVSAPCNLGTISEVGGVTGPVDARGGSDDCEKYSHDRNGNRAKLVKRDGSIITYQYDALNRNTVKIVPERAGLGATHARDVYYGYDLRGLQTYARFDSASGEGLTTAYDGFGRMVSSSLAMDGATRTLSYLHDRNGNRTRVTHPDGTYLYYVHDGLDRMTLAQINGGPGVGGYSYNNRGLPAEQLYGAYSAFGYDMVGRLASFNHNFAGSAQDVSYGLNYNPASQITMRTIDNDGYVYTGAVNVNRSYGVNGLNQYSSSGPRCFDYDGNGNLTADKNCAAPADASRTNYLYDIENRLVSASGAMVAGLRYDPLGRLYETSGGTAGITRFLYDGDELVAEYDSAGNMLRRYGHGMRSDDPMVWYEGATVSYSAARFYRADHQGSIVALGDWYGNGVAINAYDEWGVPAATNIGRFQYTGQAWIPELKMYHYKARIYSPTLGRFLQTDPIGYDDQVNLYDYVSGDPVNNVDPTGEVIDTIADIAFIVADVADIAVNGLNATNGVSLGANIVGAAIPGATGLGAGTRALMKGGDVARTARAERLAQNAAQGARGEAATAKKLGDTVAGKQVTFKASDGTKSRADFVTKGRGVVETKTGNARLSTNQQKLHGDIKAGREVTPVGRNARDAGLEPGKPTRMKSCSIDRQC